MADKDDEGSPTDDSGEGESDDSDRGSEEVKNFIFIFSIFILPARDEIMWTGFMTSIAYEFRNLQRRSLKRRPLLQRLQ